MPAGKRRRPILAIIEWGRPAGMTKSSGENRPCASARDTALDAAPAAVDIRSVSKNFGRVVALDGVTLSIRRGEFFSLLGPSGCGKTTLLRIVGGFEDLTAGEVQIDGKDCGFSPPYARNTNMIFQHLALFPHMNVFENVAFGLRRKRVPKAQIAERVETALALVRLEGFDQRMIDQLSGGQKQRVAMARALVNNPAVLLLDEPLGALDLQLRLQMQDELRRLHRSLGNTFIYVTHDQGEAMTMSDRIAVMSDGRIQQVGTPVEIYERPRTRFVASFIGHTNLLDGIVVEKQAAGGLLVDCRGTPLPCIAGRPFDVGERVTVALRYEKVGLAREGSGETSVPATVTERTYLGSAVRLETRLANGIDMTADINDTDRAQQIHPGDTVKLGYMKTAAVAVAD
jgi:spermidine/putrescine transport system ATP-binding protein